MRIKNNTDYGQVSSMNFDDTGISIYTYSGINSFVSYKDVSAFNIVVNTHKISSKNAEKTIITTINICIKENKNEYELISGGDINTLYKILNYKKYVGNFKLSIQGPMDNIGILLKVYSRFGIKLSPQNYQLTIPAFVMTCVVGYALYTDVFNQRMFDMHSAFINLFWEMLIFYVAAFILSGIIAYNEYKKFKIRRILKL